MKLLCLNDRFVQARWIAESVFRDMLVDAVETVDSHSLDQSMGSGSYLGSPAYDPAFVTEQETLYRRDLDMFEQRKELFDSDTLVPKIMGVSI